MPQYNGVWTLEAAAQAQSNQQWVTDPNFRNTTLLLQADGTAGGAQNNTFLDSSSNAFAIARTGTPTQGTFTPFSQAEGRWSNYFDGSGDNLLTPSNAAFNPSGSDITVDFFVYFTRYANTANVIFEVGTSAVGDMQCNVQNTGEVRFTIGGSVGSVKSGFVLNTWNYITCVKSGTNFTVYLNGVAGTTVSLTPNSKTQMYIGQQSGGNTIDGYISNFRYVRGSAIIPTAIPTSPLTAITNTSLLTCQSNRFVDNSSNSFALTVTGNTSVQTFSPFAPQFQWTEPVIGGAAYFAGIGNYLLPTANALFAPGNTGAWTFEAFVYIPTTTSGYIYAVGNGASYGNSMLCSWGSNTFSFSQGNGGSNPVSISSAANFPPFAWYHYAVVKNASNLITMYINGVQVGTPVTYTAGIATGITPVINGGYDNNGLGNNGLNCYTSNLRWIKGTAIYSGTSTTAPNFVVPTAPLTATMGANPFGGSNTAAATATFLANFTNAGIYDGAMDNVLQTVGNAQVSTSVVKYGSGSMYFDGTGDYLIARYNKLFGLLDNQMDFTVEMWVYKTVASTDQVLLSTQEFSGTYTGWAFNFTSANLLQFYCYDSGNNPQLLVSTGTVPLNTWVHIAAVRLNGITKLYINGINDGTRTTAFFNSVTESALCVGCRGTLADQLFTGYMDDVRITFGLARYTANFIPPLVALPRQ